MNSECPNLLAVSLHDFFTRHLPILRGLSPCTIQSYRDSLVLLLRFVSKHIGKSVADLSLADITPMEIQAFLQSLEEERQCTASTRNVRLSAIHCFYRYLAASHPEQLERVQRVLGVPFKRTTQKVVQYLERDEIEKVLNRIDRAKPEGERDYALLAVMFNTGSRVQEVLDLRACDLQLIKPFQIRLLGKGRKERFCPLWPQTAQLLRTFCTKSRIDLKSEDRIFLNQRHRPLTRFGVRYILAKRFQEAQTVAPSLAAKRLHPHSLRHSTAIALLKSGVDLSTISQWLGHASLNTTNRYATIDMEMKRQAIARVKPLKGVKSHPSPWSSCPSILEWLQSL
jgi:site-specific recombinase XerD